MSTELLPAKANGHGAGNGGNPPARPAVEAVRAAIDQLKALRTFVAEEMQAGIDYGVIPGTDKPTLYLAGAQKTAMYFRVTGIPRHQRTELGGGHLEVVSTCRLTLRESGVLMAMGAGSCTTMESKYRFQTAARACPACGAAAIRRSKPEYGGGWYCNQKAGGCGAKFAATDPEVTGRAAGRVENPNPYDLRNTVLKMSAKRALIAAALNLGAMSEFFTQDLEDMDVFPVGAPPPPPPPEPAPAGGRPAKAGGKAKAAVDRDFPAPPAAPPAPAAGPRSWDEYVGDAVKAAALEWRNEMAIAGVPRERREELCTRFSLTNWLVSHAIAAGRVDAAKVGTGGDPKRRDRRKAWDAAGWLYADDPQWVVREVAAHLREKAAGLRAALGTGEYASQERPEDSCDPDTELPPEREREPGDDDDRGDS